ncbi:hypothetical protein BP6252_08208 [Coleophoma cylindrospora]|uniref:Uncharacterized protein n=1 Tax=Coleophoma cylindrospora TaxID=1849047 RepID=A0A3D8RCA2_9HELO|nr:hypothetical protein BP6252_08208 [Coleophoma cylindrospora]
MDKRQYLGDRYSSKAKVCSVLKNIFPATEHPSYYDKKDGWEFGIKVSNGVISFKAPEILTKVSSSP